MNSEKLSNVSIDYWSFWSFSTWLKEITSAPAKDHYQSFTLYIQSLTVRPFLSQDASSFPYRCALERIKD